MDLVLIPLAEDQQRINTFSKLNTRVRSLAEKMNGLKVSSDNLSVSFSACLILGIQQEKEAFDDLAMELELTDEDQPVLYDRLHDAAVCIV
jgi:prefoldin subunit 4